MKYKIVFRGKFNSEVDQADILENLSELFDESKDDIYEQFFLSKDKTQILISGLNNEDAIEYKEALAEAGVEADIDIDLDFEDFEDLSLDVGLDSTVSSKEILGKPDPEIVSPQVATKQNIRHQFLEPQEFTLMVDNGDVESNEINRVEKLKRITKQRTEYLEIDDQDVHVEPPLFHSGVRIGRLRFLCRITFALAILMACLNVFPLYLKTYLGDAGFIPSFLFVFLAFTFVIMVISQRFCDIDNLSVSTVAFVVVILGILLISFFIGNYDALTEAKVKFVQEFLQSNSMSQNFFSMQKVLEAYLSEVSQRNIIQQADSIVKWIIYLLVFFGAIILFSTPSIEGNNQFGSQSSEPNMMSYIIFVISLLCLIYSMAYPYSSRENRVAHRVYQNEMYEYLGLLKPLPDDFERIYKEHLQKTQQKLGN